MRMQKAFSLAFTLELRQRITAERFTNPAMSWETYEQSYLIGEFMYVMQMELPPTNWTEVVQRIQDEETRHFIGWNPEQLNLIENPNGHIFEPLRLFIDGQEVIEGNVQLEGDLEDRGNLTFSLLSQELIDNRRQIFVNILPNDVLETLDNCIQQTHPRITTPRPK